jgi:hypothetical protein
MILILMGGMPGGWRGSGILALGVRGLGVPEMGLGAIVIVVIVIVVVIAVMVIAVIAVMTAFRRRLTDNMYECGCLIVCIK